MDCYYRALLCRNCVSGTGASNAGIGQQLQKELDRRIMIIDGAMGTMIQTYKLQEEDFRG